MIYKKAKVATWMRETKREITTLKEYMRRREEEILVVDVSC